MNWIELTEENQLENIKERSEKRPQVIFKHSTRCSVSAIAKNRLERDEEPDGVDFYHLDLIKFRNISNKVAEHFDIYHESPQLLLIKNGACVYDESHSGIRMDDLNEQVKNN